MAYDADISLNVGTELDPVSLSTTAKQLADRLDKAIDGAMGKNTSVKFKQYQLKADKLANTMVKVHDTLLDMEMNAQPSKELTELTEKARQAKEEYKSLQSYVAEKQDAGINVPNIVMDQLAEAKENFTKLTYETAEKAREEGDALEASYNGFLQKLKDVENELTIVLQQLEQTGRQEGIYNIGENLPQSQFANFTVTAQNLKQALQWSRTSDINSAFNRIGGAAQRAAVSIGKLGPVLKNVFQNLLNIARQGVPKLVGGLKKLATWFIKTRRTSKTSSNGIVGALKKIFAYGLGITTLVALFSKLRGAISEGLGNLAQYSPQFKSTINDFKNALTGLKNAFGAAFAPIASVVLPLLTRLISMVTAAVNAIGKLIAALTGRSTYTAAVSGFSDVGAAAGGANEQAQELQKTLSGFDDVEILKSENANSGGGGGGGGGGAGDMFEEVPIDDNLAKLAEMIKEAWEKADFTEIGTIVGTKLKNALDSIPWDEIKEVCNRIAKSVATFLNGFFETPGLFESIGHTLAEAMNTAIDSLRTFASNLHWDSIGTALANGLNQWIKDFNWENAGVNLSTWVNGLLTLFINWVTKTSWYELGQSVGSMITSAIQNTEWSKFGSAAAGALNALVDYIRGVVEETDFEELAHGIADAIITFFAETDWDEFAETVKEVFTALGTFFGTLADDLDLAGLGKALMEDLFTAIKNNATLQFVWWQTAFPGLLYNAIADGINSIIPNLNEIFNKILDPWDILPDVEIPFLPKIKDPEAAYKAAKQTLENESEKSHVELWAEGVVQAMLDRRTDKSLETTAKYKEAYDGGVPNSQKQIETTAKYKEAYDGGIPANQKELDTTAIAKEMVDMRKEKGLSTKANMDTVDTSALTGANKPSVHSTSSLNSVDKTGVSGKNKPWLNTDAYIGGVGGYQMKFGNYSSGDEKKRAKPWMYVDAFIGGLGGYQMKYGNYSSGDEKKRPKPWMYVDAFIGGIGGYQMKFGNYSSGGENNRAKPWINTDAYFNSMSQSNWFTNALWWATTAKFTWVQDALTASQKTIEVTAKYREAYRAGGGVFTSKSGWSAIPQYAEGTVKGGSIFIAGEAGPEVVGHIGGRTEVLNRSQLAHTMYSSIIAALKPLTASIESLLRYFSTQLGGIVSSVYNMLQNPIPVILDSNSSSMINSMINSIPAIVSGQIVPYETRLTAVEDKLDSQTNTDAVTNAELRNMLSDVIEAINKVQFYIGDEQIARHATSGNQKLDRRYNPIMQGS